LLIVVSQGVSLLVELAGLKNGKEGWKETPLALESLKCLVNVVLNDGSSRGYFESLGGADALVEMVKVKLGN
jgi:hypothetical protein